ncbi:MAG: hypothetical protein OXC60_11225 [Litoreibacter sp.]|nr:hypothetical protein [Litoreibacter sp.]MCY4335225.1 hypothetical protein [Litoreibacter sp.]
MMIVILLLVAMGLAFLMSVFGGRFDIRKPAIWLTGLGVAGAVFFVIAVGLSDNGPFAIMAILGTLISLVSMFGLLSLVILWAYRRWSGFYEER